MSSLRSDRPRAKEAFARKIVGKEKVTDAEVELVGADGREVSVEVSSVPLKEGHQIVGVFGLLSRPPSPPKSPRPHAKLTPRQREVLGLLAHGSSTHQIADAPPPEQGDRAKSHPRGPAGARSPLPRGSRRNGPRRGPHRRLTQLGQAPKRADLHHLAAVRNLKLSPAVDELRTQVIRTPSCVDLRPRRGSLAAGRPPPRDPPSRQAPAPCPAGARSGCRGGATPSPPDTSPGPRRPRPSRR